ncbi:MAG: HAD family hydrolase [Pseudomonadota bacterium]
MSELKALLFDVDGTLADTERDGHRVAFNLAFDDAGLGWHWSVDDYAWLLQVTGGKERIRFFIEQKNPPLPADVDLDSMIPELHRSKTDHYTHLLGEGRIPLRAGVERLINEARGSGMRLAIATTTTPANVTALLENTLGAESIAWFEVIAAGDVVPAKKPAPDIYQWAMQQMLLKPAECIAFEDSENGVISVKDSGIRAVLVATNHYTEEHDFDGATSVIDQLGDPGSPLHNIAGVRIDGDLVDMAAVRRIHAAANA